ncbi:MAG TPA: nodulation protein NfeD [Pseudomonadales bacterium]
MIRAVAGLLLILLGALPLAAGEAEAPRGRSQVWVVDLDGAVGPAVADLIVRTIDDAEEAGAAALVIRMDTPGGLDKSMRQIIQAILAADVPVVTYVAPNGARAASAGTYIAFASHIAAMAPATNIGSSTPVAMGGPAPPTPGAPGPDEKPDADGGKGGEGGEAGEGTEAPGDRRDEQSTDAMTRKVINDAVAYLQSLAELRGRNVEWAEETVRYGANLRASEALANNVIDVVASDLNDLLEQIDDRSVTLDDRTVQLDVAGAGIRRVETDWRHKLLIVITDPTIAYGLLIFGIYGLILEFYNPGMIFPSVIGIVCLLLGAYGLQMLPVNYAGLALIVVGIGMMVAELFTPSMGILGVAGAVAFVIGSIMLIDTEMPGYRVPYLVIGAFAAATAGLTAFVLGAAVRARQQQVVTGPQGMIGGTGEALEDFSDNGFVWAFGERWRARTQTPVKKGDRVRIVDIEGLTLIVTGE